MSGEQVGWGVHLTPSEVAAIFNVDPKTVTSWAKAGKLSAVRTPGGHRRFPLSEIVELMARGSQQPGT
jgi:excisionase family DNA binding protein